MIEINNGIITNTETGEDIETDTIKVQQIGQSR